MGPLVSLATFAGALYAGHWAYKRFFNLRAGDIAEVPAKYLQPVPPGVPGFTATAGNGSPLDVKVLVLISKVEGGVAGGQALSWRDIGSAGYLAVNGTKFDVDKAEPYTLGGYRVRDVSKDVTLLPSPINTTQEQFLSQVATQPGMDFGVMMQNSKGEKALVTVESLGYDAMHAGNVLAVVVPGSLPVPGWVPPPGSIVTVGNLTAWPLPGQNATQVT